MRMGKSLTVESTSLLIQIGVLVLLTNTSVAHAQSPTTLAARAQVLVTAAVRAEARAEASAAAQFQACEAAHNAEEARRMALLDLRGPDAWALDERCDCRVHGDTCDEPECEAHHAMTPGERRALRTLISRETAAARLCTRLFETSLAAAVTAEDAREAANEALTAADAARAEAEEAARYARDHQSVREAHEAVVAAELAEARAQRASINACRRSQAANARAIRAPTRATIVARDRARQLCSASGQALEVARRALSAAETREREARGEY